MELKSKDPAGRRAELEAYRQKKRDRVDLAEDGAGSDGEIESASGRGAGEGGSERAGESRGGRKYPIKRMQKIKREVRAELKEMDLGELVHPSEVELLNPGELPEDIGDRVQAGISEYMGWIGLESMEKAYQPQWQACCVWVGDRVVGPIISIPGAGRDHPRYDVERCLKIVDLWRVLCGSYRKVPLAGDACAFLGMGDMLCSDPEGEWKLNPESIKLRQKIHAIQELGLAGIIADGRAAPTGPLAILNHWHGWTQSREIIHTSASTSAISAGSLPRLDG